MVEGTHQEGPYIQQPSPRLYRCSTKILKPLAFEGLLRILCPCITKVSSLCINCIQIFSGLYRSPCAIPEAAFPRLESTRQYSSRDPYHAYTLIKALRNIPPKRIHSSFMQAPTLCTCRQSTRPRRVRARCPLAAAAMETGLAAKGKPGFGLWGSTYFLNPKP